MCVHIYTPSSLSVIHIYIRKEEIKKAALIIIELKNKYSNGLKSFNISDSASPSITVNEKNVSANQKIKSDKQHGEGTIEINQGSQSNLTAIFSIIGIIVILVALIIIWQKNNSDKENLLSNEKERVELIITEVNQAISQTKYETALKYLDSIAWKLNPENNKELVEQYNIRRETLRQIIDSLISQQYYDFALEKNLSTNEQVDSLNIDTESIVNENIFIDSQGAKLTLGEEYEGGIIIKLYYSSSIPHGLIVSKTDLFSGNWNDAVSLCNSYMNDGFEDWHLPSLAELKILFEKKNLVNNFKDNWYWSSTDYNNFAYHLGFISGDELLVPKENTKYVRAVRNF